MSIFARDDLYDLQRHMAAWPEDRQERAIAALVKSVCAGSRKMDRPTWDGVTKAICDHFRPQLGIPEPGGKVG